MILQNALYLPSMPKWENGDLLCFMVLKDIRLLLWMGVIEMQDIKAVTIPYPYYKNIFGGQDDETIY